MKHLTLLLIGLVSGLTLLLSDGLKAQTKIAAELLLTSEVQTNFGSLFKSVNLLQCNGSIHFAPKNSYRGGNLSVQFITPLRTSDIAVCNDLQGFSNIEADNYFFTPFLFGYTQYLKKGLVFAGLRNVNEDYFTTDYTVLFTQSSAGIHPTLSGNFELPNYPFTAPGLFVEYLPEPHTRLRTSLYNGAAGTFSSSGPHPFHFDYNSYGIFILQDLLFEKWDFRVNIGSMAHLSANIYNRGSVVWGIIEKPIIETSSMELGVILEGSYAFMRNPSCRSFGSFGFVGDGLIGQKGKSIIASQIFYSGYQSGNEFDLEINWIYRPLKYLQIQPALHLIVTDKVHPVGLLRLSLDFKV